MYDSYSLYIIGKQIWTLLGNIDDDDMYTQEDYDLIIQVLEDDLNDIS